MLPLMLLATPPAQIQDAPAAEALLAAARARASVVLAARKAFLEAGGEAKAFQSGLAQDLAQVNARLALETRPAERQALILTGLLYHRLDRAVPPAALLEAAAKEVPATHPGWTLEPSLLPAFAGWTPAGAAVLAAARAGHPDGALRRGLLFTHFMDGIEEQPEAVWRPSFEALQKDFAGAPEALRAVARLEAERKTAPGTAAPAFALPALDDPKVTLGPEHYKGSYVLMDFWASWCPDCVRELPGLHRAYDRFKAKGLRVLSLSFDRKVEHVARYRQQKGTPMAWDHVFLEGGFKHPVSAAYGVMSIPRALLVGPDGKVVAVGADLHGARLEETLARFLGK